MAKTARLQDLQWRLETAGYDLVAAILHAAPIDAASAFGGTLFKWLGPLTSTHRTVLRNLRLAFPEWDEVQRRQMARRQWENVGRVLIESFLTDRIMADPDRVELIGLDQLEALKATGRPIMFVSGHFANWEIMAATKVKADIEGVLAYRGLNNPYIDQRMRDSRRRYGVNLFAPKSLEGGREMVAALKAGLSVGVLTDQKYYEGPLIPFFGHPVRTQHAPVRFAMRFGAHLQPGWVERTNGARFKVFVAEEIPLPAEGGAMADVEAALLRINAFIEERARARPWEYWWVHRKFPDALYRQLAAEGY
ncbi:MAG TPA: lysophospholipid acyltransferase family protein [Caulobacteraceae bacterium]|jgi:KDO2-lipid IV(A) lauroyltransferase|nr:lysophospholipid acyltransferase family protein [Caulobacteraceae bacterium]